MGCSSGKETKVNIKSLRLQNVGVHSVDSFNDQVEVVINKFAALTDGIEYKRKRLDDLTGFWWYRQADRSIRNSVMGIILQFLAVANGDLTKIKIDIIEHKPFVKIALNGLTLDRAMDYIEYFQEYVEEIFECLTEKMPVLLKEMVELADKAVALKDNAQGEFEALDPFKKVGAIAKTVKLISEIPKIPAFMKQCIAEI